MENEILSIESKVGFVDALAEHVESKVQEFYKTNPTHRCFEEVNKINGRDVVTDYISHGEFGIAVDHLLYVVHGVPVLIDENLLIRLHSIARSLGRDSECFDKIKFDSLTQEQQKWVWNVVNL